MQDKVSNYDTDIFQPIFKSIQNVFQFLFITFFFCFFNFKIIKCREYTGKIFNEDLDGVDMAYRVVSDHIRTLTIAINDGGTFENFGRGFSLLLLN